MEQLRARVAELEQGEGTRKKEGEEEELEQLKVR